MNGRGADAGPGCRALVAGFGRPGQRDLDFGRQLVRYLEQLEWPDGVVVEDLSCAAPLVLHRLQELQPAKVVLVGATSRGADQPGSLRRYRLDLTPPPPEDVQRSLEDSVGGMVDIDHTLAVARHFGSLPPETVVVEVEPVDCSFGVGFSEDLAPLFDPILAIVREEVGHDDPDGDALELRLPDPVAGEPEPAASRGLAELAEYAARHTEARMLDRHRGGPITGSLPATAGLGLAARSRPWGLGSRTGGDWFDVILLEDGWVGVVVGDVAGRGVEAAGAMSDLRAAVRAYAVVDGDAPGRVLAHLDRLVGLTGMDELTTLVYLAVRPATGEVRLSNAGHCPPLVLGAPGGTGRFLWDASSAPLGALSAAAGPRPEETLVVTPGTTILLFTDGLVADRERAVPDGLEALQRAVAHGPDGLDELCDHVMGTCLTDGRRDDDVCLLGVRLPTAVRSPAPPAAPLVSRPAV